MPGIRGADCMFDQTPLFGFIGVNYLFFTVVQVLIALRAQISLFKMFQWIFWLLVSIFSFLGAYAVN
ncbi:hypothetical protein OU798_12800 [Prolixibacteraceae bacterium Z1-6]|uniref:Uncharacterized protein n=1 Tax=Draconibacterium aestuarii TaxID=2998507 RepID=A0A9X3J575_9BACT|nr:hypothetical protein [Prolixibacteraceae bacterium Z1-6]